MAVTEVVAYGEGGVNQNAFAVDFSTALSSVVTYHAYDNDQTFPTLESPALTTTANHIFSEGATSSASMIALIDTTNAEPSNTWATDMTTAAENQNPNWLKGDANYVTQAGAVRGAGERVLFNMGIEVNNTVTTSMSMGFEVCVKYTYTGSVPTVTWKYNTGTAGTPTWTAMTAAHGIKHCRSTAAAGSLYANIPESGHEWTTKAFECDVDD